MWTWDLAPPAREEFQSLPDIAQDALMEFLDSIIQDDPRGIREAAARIDPGGVWDTFPFGSTGLVTVLIHVRGAQVLVMQIVWAGDTR